MMAGVLLTELIIMLKMELQRQMALTNFQMANGMCLTRAEECLVP